MRELSESVVPETVGDWEGESDRDGGLGDRLWYEDS